MYLNRCVDSILNQSYQNIEIVLVNDGSKDSSGEICDDYKKKHHHIKVIHHLQSSGSAGAPRNSGLDIATGEFISFIDSDDWIHPEMIEVIISSMIEKNADVGECDLIGTDEYCLKEIKIENLTQKLFNNKIDALKHIIKNHRFSVCVRIFKKSLIDKVRFPENVISEDVYFTLNVFNKTNSLVKINAPFYYYFNTPNSVTRKIYTLKYLDTLDSGLYLQKYIQERENDEELLTIVQTHVLKKLMYHYKMLNYFPEVDPKYSHRESIKKLIDKNYFASKSHNSYLKLAKYLSLNGFEKIIKLNRFKHRIFNTNQFS